MQQKHTEPQTAKTPKLAASLNTVGGHFTKCHVNPCLKSRYFKKESIKIDKQCQDAKKNSKISGSVSQSCQVLHFDDTPLYDVMKSPYVKS